MALRKLTPAYALISELVDFADALYDLLKEAHELLRINQHDLETAIELRRSDDESHLDRLTAFNSHLDALFGEHPSDVSTKPDAAPGWYGDRELVFWVDQNGWNVYGISTKRGLLPDEDHHGWPVVFIGKLYADFPTQVRDLRLFDRAGEIFGVSAGDLPGYVYNRVGHFLTEAKTNA